MRTQIKQPKRGDIYVEVKEIGKRYSTNRDRSVKRFREEIVSNNQETCDTTFIKIFR